MRKPHEACLRLPEQDPCLLCNLVVAQDIHIRQDGSFEVPLDSLDYAWFRVGGLDYAARYSMAE
jgi:hypothetical protein